MKRAIFLVALTLVSAIPAYAQQTSMEFGAVFGASRRSIDNVRETEEGAYLDDEFSLENSAVDLFWGVQIEPQTMFKIRLGRIETPVRYEARVDRNAEGRVTERYGDDVPGEVQHLEGVVEYRFSEAFGRTGLFAGVGLYRHSGEGIETTSDYGFLAGLNADFPLSRRYGLMVEAAYHVTRAEFRPRYLTLGAGLRVAF